MTSPSVPPRPGLRDHAEVAWVLVLTALNLIPLAVVFFNGWWLAPLLRRRNRLRLRDVRAAAPAEPPAPAAWEGRRLEVVAGEVSGDRLVAPVVHMLRAQAPEPHH